MVGVIWSSWRRCMVMMRASFLGRGRLSICSRRRSTLRLGAFPEAFLTHVSSNSLVVTPIAKAKRTAISADSLRRSVS